MKKFLLKCTLFATGVGILFIVLIVFKISTENSVSVLFHLKNEKLAQHSNKPKLIIIGGSNARYGFDSKFLEKKLGRPVINAAITYHQGLAYYLEWSKLYLNEGDYVLLSPEYALTSSKEGLYGTDKLIDVAHKNNHFIKYLLSEPRALFTQLLQSHWIINQSMESLTAEETNKEVLLATHNSNGDAINCHGKSKNFVPTSITFEKPFEEYYAVLNEFAVYCESKNVKVFVSFPPVREGSITIEAAPEVILAQTKQNLDNLLLVNTPKSAIYPDKYFYDSSYHLNHAGKKIHTENVYSHMMQALKQDNKKLAL